MTENNPDTVLAAGSPKAKIVSLISAARDVHGAAVAKREPPRIATDHGEAWYHDAAIRHLKEVH